MTQPTPPNEKQQFHLPIIDLIDLGFIQEITKDKRVIYKINFINSSIYFNPEEPQYTWYLQMTLGRCSNHINLNILSLDDLKAILKIFNLT